MKHLSRRSFTGGLISAGSGLALAPLSGCSTLQRRQSRSVERPNILFLFSDQQRWDSVSCYGAPLFPNLTPALDQMAAEGVRFEYAFTNQPVCGPARACLQTGRYAVETGCYTNDVALRLDEKTMAHYLAAVGYEVGYMGKLHLASQYTYGIWPEKGYASDGFLNTPDTLNFLNSPVPPERRCGYKDFWLAADSLEYTTTPYEGYMFDSEGNRRDYQGIYRADAQTDWVIEYLRTRDGKRPFFLFCSYLEPHHELSEPGRFAGPKGSRERFRNFIIPGDLRGKPGPWSEEMPDYLGCCSSLDRGVGRILTELKRLGLLENTLVIYSSDHGCHFRTLNSTDKCSCHDSSTRVPLIIRGPGFRGGQVISELVSTVDMTATVLDAAGAGHPNTLRGRPLQDLTKKDTPAGWPPDVFIQISNHPGASDEDALCGRALRSKKWIYSVRAPKERNRYPDSEIYYEDYLFDLQQDPSQQRNLVDDPDMTNVRLRLAERLKERMVMAGEKTPQILPGKSE